MTDFPMTLEPSLYAKQMFDSRILPPDLLAAWKAGHEHLDHLSAAYMALVLITMNELEEAEEPCIDEGCPNSHIRHVCI